MDWDIYHLTFHYLLKAQKLVVSGQEHKAILQLGLNPEAIPVLKRLPTAKLEELAKSNTSCFAIRFPAQFWKDLGQEDAGEPIPESLFLHLLGSNAMGRDDDDVTQET